MTSEPTLLAKRNSHPRDKFVKFYEGPHKYEITFKDSETGELFVIDDFTSVTTFNHAHFEEFDEDKIIDKMMNGKNWKQSKYYGMTREEIKAQWEANRNEAATAGTKMHYDIECYYNDIDNGNNSIEFKYFLEFEKERTKPGGWGEHFRPYRTEWVVYDEDAELVGTIDMVYEDSDGVLHIYDWKRSKKIVTDNRWQTSNNTILNHIPDSNYWHYCLQLNTYKAILERKYGKKVGYMYLVCLHPDNWNGTFQRIQVKNLSKEVNELFSQRMKMLADSVIE
jgi:ATP-dependent exoDNAse (exonuclease V) beta subunit